MLSETRLRDKRWAHELKRRMKTRHNYTGANNHHPVLKMVSDYTDETTNIFKVKSMFKKVLTNVSAFFRSKTC